MNRTCGERQCRQLPAALHVLAAPGLSLVSRYQQFKQERREQRRIAAEKELETLHCKIRRLLEVFPDVIQETTTSRNEECVVCMCAPASMETLPCGHKVLCRLCFIKTIHHAVIDRQLPLRCVVCRTKIIKLSSKSRAQSTKTKQRSRSTDELTRYGCRLTRPENNSFGIVHTNDELLKHVKSAKSEVTRTGGWSLGRESCEKKASKKTADVLVAAGARSKVQGKDKPQRSSSGAPGARSKIQGKDKPQRSSPGRWIGSDIHRSVRNKLMFLSCHSPLLSRRDSAKHKTQ